jgi:uncharacterized protein with von Willebrand factor type A (vWA) domain
MGELSPARGALTLNIVYFARALRDVGMPVGPGATLDAVHAAEAAGFSTRGDFRAAMHAVFVKRHEHTILFDQVFDTFWKRRGLVDKLISMMSPQAKPEDGKPKPPEAGASRVADALNKAKEKPRPRQEELEYDARLTMSAVEVLQRKDFAQMSAEEIARARRLINALELPFDRRRIRRFAPDAHGLRIDPRRSFRASLRGGGSIDLAFRDVQEKPPPVTALLDISGSMSEYTRLILHFLHALGEKRPVTTFLFGTRLTNVTRALRRRDPDEALLRCSAEAPDWSGGTRISASLRRFNREWSRRVLGQGAIVLLFTDGLERDGVEELGLEMERLHKSCRRLIWLNPLLRFDAFEPRALGMRAMMPHVDEFRPIHNLASMGELCSALSGKGQPARSPRDWMKG